MCQVIQIFRFDGHEIRTPNGQKFKIKQAHNAVT